MSDDLAMRRAAAPPFSRLLVIGLILLALIQVGAFVRAFTLSPELESRLSLPLAWSGVISAGWAAAFAWAAWGVARRRWRVIRWAAVIVAGYGLYTVGRLVIFAQADYDRGRLPFLGLGLVLIVVVLAAYQIGVRR